MVGVAGDLLFQLMVIIFLFASLEPYLSFSASESGCFAHAVCTKRGWKMLHGCSSNALSLVGQVCAICG